MISDLQRQLGIDASFFTQFALFLFVFIWLQIIYFGPFLKLIQRRESQSEGLSEGATQLEEEAARLEQDYQEKSISSRKRVAAERENILAAARKEANDVTSKAREQAKVKVEQSREQAQKESATELQSLQAQVGSVTSQLVQKLTSAKVGL